MKCIAAVEVNLTQSPLGTRSRAADELLGKPVLTRTVEQISRSRNLDHLFVLCPPDQQAACQRLIPADVEDQVTVRVRRVHTDPFRALVRTARKWSLDGWRGGIGGTCSMDEYTRSDELALLAHGESADALFCAPASAPLIDPELIDTMIEHARRTVEESRITFVQAPPGLAGTVYRTDILIEMAQQRVPPGVVLSYKPDNPMMDLAHKSCCYTAPASVRHAGGRLIVDTDRAFRTVHDYLAAGLPINAESVGHWLIERSNDVVPHLPVEVEIELTTEDQLADTLLRPRGPAVVGRRGPLDVDVVRKIAAELGAVDDSLVVLGGFGEPLLHPRFDDILAALRDGGVYGLAVRTNGLALDERRIDALIQNRVDVLAVTLDACTPDLYEKVHGANRLEDAIANLRCLVARRAECASVAPLVVPEMVKCTETIPEMDPFFDHWVRETGWAYFTGYCHYSHRRPDRSVITMTPPSRTACRRIRNRAMILADGRMVICDQDFAGQYTIGNLTDATLRELWHAPAMHRARDRHRRGCFDATPLCARCDEWHRP